MAGCVATPVVYYTECDCPDGTHDTVVAETPEEAEEFLEDCMAVVVKNLKGVRAYFEDEADITGMSDEELLEASEVFALPSGRFLIVEA